MYKRTYSNRVMNLVKQDRNHFSVAKYCRYLMVTTTAGHSCRYKLEHYIKDLIPTLAHVTTSQSRDQFLYQYPVVIYEKMYQLGTCFAQVT